ncbi:cpw-wpc domain-containing protein, partial [Cardiosporidium cionae]
MELFVALQFWIALALVKESICITVKSSFMPSPLVSFGNKQLEGMIASKATKKVDRTQGNNLNQIIHEEKMKSINCKQIVAAALAKGTQTSMGKDNHEILQCKSIAEALISELEDDEQKSKLQPKLEKECEMSSNQDKMTTIEEDSLVAQSKCTDLLKSMKEQTQQELLKETSQSSTPSTSKCLRDYTFVKYLSQCATLQAFAVDAGGKKRYERECTISWLVELSMLFNYILEKLFNGLIRPCLQDCERDYDALCPEEWSPLGSKSDIHLRIEMQSSYQTMALLSGNTKCHAPFSYTGIHYLSIIYKTIQLGREQEDVAEQPNLDFLQQEKRRNGNSIVMCDGLAVSLANMIINITARLHGQTWVSSTDFLQCTCQFGAHASSGDGVCEAPQGYTGPVESQSIYRPHLIYATQNRCLQIIFEEKCAAWFPCQRACQVDYSAACPDNWLVDQQMNCFPLDSYIGPCFEKVNFSDETKEGKKKFSISCNTNWPCIDDCARNYQDPCPLQWKNRDSTCFAPESYGGPCQHEKTFSLFSDAMKAAISKECDVFWPCNNGESLAREMLTEKTVEMKNSH